ncbi:MAG: TonB-dependent receptor [Halioglobus sp.]
MNIKRTPMVVAISMAIASFTNPAQLFAADEGLLEEVIVTGTRSQKERTVSDSPVPVDVLNSEEFNSMGNNADITDNLKALVPSYSATVATGDGSAFIRPTSLRGMAPDQTLVLVNGKRRHRSSLIQMLAPAAGAGAHGVDVGMIPSLGLKSVEVLRDGAAAQYGSDAIAGVVNFRMKDASEGGTVLVQYGEFFEGEQSVKVGANGGFALGDNGFLNLTAEWTDNEGQSRGFQPPDAQALIDGGAQGIGSDAAFGEAPLAQTWGRPETSGYRLFFNSGYDLNDSAEAYLFGSYNETEGQTRFFYRPPTHGSLNALVENDGYDGALLETGYTPLLSADQTDYNLVGGVRGSFSNDLYYDFSVGIGSNELDYTLDNTVNSTIGLGADGEPLQMDFDPGGLEQEEINLNADFSKALSDNVSIGFGAEWREETFTNVAGELNSYIGAGTSGLAGTQPLNAGEFDRDNWAVYGDLEHDISDDWLMQYALRYEDFSDFGDTTNGKIATRYRAADWFTFRGAVSTGFHAPSPGQSNFRTTITTFDGDTGLQVEEGLIPSTDPQAVRNGGTDLTEEKTLNYSIGFTSDIGDFTNLTIDFYLVEVDDRIYRTGDIQDGDDTISFFTNTLDVEHTGVDIVLTSNVDWSGSADTSFTLAYNHNETEVTGQGLVNGILTVSDDTISEIETNFPEDRFVFTANTRFAQDWWFMFRANYYGTHYDERGEVDGEIGNRSQKISDIIYVDLELGWDVTENWNLTLGGSNVFDEYVDEIKDDGVHANRVSVGLPYPRRTPANYEGGSWYLRASYNF